MSDQNKPESSDAALQARLNQLELENRMRHRFNSISAGADPFKDTPRKGFGSAQGIAHLRHTEYQRRGPTPPVPPPAIPEPGQAKFGGTYLRTPLPGVISGEVQNPWEELIAPVPARSPKGLDTDRADSDLRPPNPTVCPDLDSPQTGPSAAPEPPKETVIDAPGYRPVAAPAFDPGPKNVIGASAIPKAPLPPLYHAGMRAAEQAAGNPGEPAVPTPERRATDSRPISVPKEAEVRTDEPVKAPRPKRFKNPTMNSKPGS